MAEEQKGFEETLKDITTDIKRILTNRAVVLKGAYERDIIYYKVMESTLKGGAGQQERIMKEKDKRIEELEAEVDSLLFQNEILYTQLKHHIPDEKICDVKPHPYTHPIRDIPDYAKVKK